MLQITNQKPAELSPSATLGGFFFCMYDTC